MNGKEGLSGLGWAGLQPHTHNTSHVSACREELPTIYKCPYQGCTAVYRGADGMKVSSGSAPVPHWSHFM